MSSKGFLLATAATGAAAFAPGAMAADMPLKAAPAYVPPAVSWAGFYIGGHAGVAWHQAHSQNSYDGSLFELNSNKTGFIGGGQIGYNWQNGNFVFGLEADGSWLSAKASHESLDASSGLTYGTQHKIHWLSTVRSRFGLAVGNTMVYVTGGVAFGGVKNRHVFFDPDEIASESKTRVGWAIGGGVEHMWTRNWTVALEGLFVDLGRSTVKTPAGGGTFKTTRFSNQAVIGRVKLNYKW